MVIIIGHRGAMDLAPENTISSFKKALELSADMIELDVHLTKDNELVVMHDKSVDRTTDGNGEIGNLTLEQIKKLNIGENEKVPILQEVIDLVKGKCKMNLEVKDPKALRAAIIIIEKNKIEQDIIISSFLQDIVEESKKINQDIRTALLFINPDSEFLEYAQNIGVYALHTYHEVTDQELIEKAHSYGMKVHAWGVDDKESYQRMVSLGVDGVITNNPGLKND